MLLEAGAHRGTDTVDLARRWRRGYVHAFEPVPEVYSHLVKATSALRNVSTYSVALGETPGTAEMHIGSGTHDASGSLLAPKETKQVFPELSLDTVVEVGVTTIEAWATEHQIDRIDGMWLDMQGYELAALKAAGPIIDTVQAIVIEMSVVELYEGCPLWPEVREWLEETGFRVEIEDLYHPATGDALVVR